MKIRTYSELVKLKTFEERYEYLRLDGQVGIETFGYDRYLNQMFYRSAQWTPIRDSIIIRDAGCDLGIEGRELCKGNRIIIHHLNPITKKDILEHSNFLLNPDFLITTSLHTHNAIHYGDSDLLIKIPIERSINDTCPWKTK